MNNHFKSIFIPYLFFQISFLSYFYSISQLFNRIIRLADNPYRYNHFSINSDGDMIIDTESYPTTNVREFYGITKNGREYFTDNGGKKTHYYSMLFDYKSGRVEGESCFIKISSNNPNSGVKELLLGISKSESNTYKTEIYSLKQNNYYCNFYSTNTIFGELTTNVFSIIPDPLNDDTQFNYFVSYIGSPSNKNYKLYIKKINFYIYNNLDIRYNKHHTEN